MTITYDHLDKAYTEGWWCEYFRQEPHRAWRKPRELSWYKNPRLRAAYSRGVEEVKGNYKFGQGHLSDLLPPKQPNLERAVETAEEYQKDPDVKAVRIINEREEVVWPCKS